MEDRSRTRGTRTGFTTGACAAAAAKAAVVALFTGVPQSEVEIMLPIKKVVKFKIERCEISGNEVLCSVIKDAGDDPDVTHGAEICSSVSWVGTPGEIKIEGGKGVGVVTKPGIGLEIGESAINPVPRKMIRYSIEEALGDELKKRGVRVVVSVPKGEEIAKKTLNARLGIIGGISILGTTGIVRPYSTASFKASIKQAIDVAKANGCTQIVLTTGGKSEKFAMAIYPDLKEEAFVEMGDFVAFAEKCAKHVGIKKITFCGMIGKFSKIAMGVKQTHAAGSQVDMGFLAGLAEEVGTDSEVVYQIKNANSARHVYEIVESRGKREFFNLLCGRIVRVSKERLGEEMSVEAILTDFDGNVIGRAER
jgi:cobalt-precorrin-5B (C1)-methyltransferase